MFLWPQNGPKNEKKKETLCVYNVARFYASNVVTSCATNVATLLTQFWRHGFGKRQITGGKGINFVNRSVQKNSRRLWRSRRRKSSSVPEGAANFPAAVFLAGKCPNLGMDSISCCQQISEEFSSSVEICPKTFPAWNFGQPQPSRAF